ncbi:MAG: cytochrome P450 [Planctomycetaceae bacterium]
MRRALPFVGHLPWFLGNKLDFLAAAAGHATERATPLQLGGVTYLLNSPDDVCHVLSRNADNYTKSPRLSGSSSRPLFGGVLFTLDGTEHRRRRMVLQDALSRCRAESVEAITSEWVDALVTNWRGVRRVELNSQMADLVERISSSIVIGAATARAYPEVRAYALARRAYVEHRLRYPISCLERLPLPVIVRYNQARRRLVARFGALIDHATRDDAPTILSHLVRTRGGNGQGLGDDDIINEVLAMLVSGFETTAQWLVFTLYLLATHCEVQDRLVAQLFEADENRQAGAGAPAADNWTELVLYESLRLFPPTWLFLRIATAADTLPSGTRVEAGAKIYICPYTLHRNPRIFSDPLTFDPARFSRRLRQTIPRSAYIPFGDGPRACVGETVALLQARCIVEGILRRYQLSPAPGQTIRLSPGVTLQPRQPIYLELTPREAACPT